MRTIHYIPLLIILFLAACTPEENILPDEQGNVTFLFTTESEINTRTVLNSSENRQHVEEVYLYIFNGKTDAATFSKRQKLSWPAPGEVDYKGITRRYSMTLAPGEYTFLAIGLDDKSGATYNLPAAIAEGITLADAKATLASGKTKEDIAQSELFAGHVTADIKERDNDPVTITLNRRVAGVMGWFKNVPANTSKIQISLYTQQNKSGYLIKQKEGSGYPSGIKNPDNFKDFIESPISETEADKILVTIDVPAETEATNILSGGSYVLPAAAPRIIDSINEYTLLLEVIDADGNTTQKKKAKMKEEDDLYISPTSGGTGIIDASGPYRFPIVANRFYSIGTNDAPIDLGEGDDIVITVNPDWEGGETIPLL